MVDIKNIKEMEFETIEDAVEQLNKHFKIMKIVKTETLNYDDILNPNVNFICITDDAKNDYKFEVEFNKFKGGIILLIEELDKYDLEGNFLCSKSVDMFNMDEFKSITILKESNRNNKKEVKRYINDLKIELENVMEIKDK